MEPSDGPLGPPAGTEWEEVMEASWFRSLNEGGEERRPPR